MTKADSGRSLRLAVDQLVTAAIGRLAILVGFTVAGCFLGLILTAFAGAIYAVAGRAAMEAAHGPLLNVARNYVASGAIGGVLIGLLSPLGRWSAGVFVLGWVGAAALYVPAAIAKFGPLSAWGRWEWGGVVFLSLFLGSAGAVTHLRQEGRWRFGGGPDR